MTETQASARRAPGRRIGQLIGQDAGAVRIAGLDGV
jgi:hypothetical protein